MKPQGHDDTLLGDLLGLAAVVIIVIALIVLREVL